MSLADRDFTFASGERVIATALDDIPPDHYERYKFAVECLQDMKGPLTGADIFCGVGYGTRLLAESLPCFLLAVDGSGETIAKATQIYKNLNLMFCHKVFPFTLPSESFDFIVSMESIEHVEDGEWFFEVLAGAIKPGGRMVISAPNSKQVDLAKNPYKWHYRHYTNEEIVALGRKHGFEHIASMGADCTVVNDEGRVVSGNYYSPYSGTLKAGHPGDTLTHYFKKNGG